jgi:hypothetical protein
MNTVWQVGIVLLLLGLVALVIGLLQRRVAAKITGTPFVKTGDLARGGPSLASPKGLVSVQGNVVCQQPLLAPMSGTPCVYCEVKVTSKWKEGETVKEKTLQEDKRAAQFAIDDGSGPIWIDATEGGAFDPTKSSTQTQKAGLIGGLTGQELMFGNFKLSTGALSLGTEFTVREEYMPVVPQLYALGRFTEQGAIGTPKGLGSLMLDQKPRDALVASAVGLGKYLTMGGAAGLGLGLVLSIIGAIIGKPAKPTAAATVASAVPSATAAMVPTPPASASAAPAETAATKPAALPGKPSPATKPAAAPATPAAKPAVHKK